MKLDAVQVLYLMQAVNVAEIEKKELIPLLLADTIAKLSEKVSEDDTYRLIAFGAQFSKMLHDTAVSESETYKIINKLKRPERK